MFFHLSNEDLGKEFTFTPKLPESALISKEGNIPRVCVCPSIFHCMRAISSQTDLYAFDIYLWSEGNTNQVKSPTIYATEERPYIPPNASDFRRNYEGWFIVDIKMHRVGYLDLRSLSKGKIKIISKPNKITKEIAESLKDVLIEDAYKKIDIRTVFLKGRF